MKNLATDTAHMATGSGLSVEAQRNLAAEAGIRLESAHMPLDPNMADHVGFGQLAGFNQQVMKMTGHSWWSNRVRTNSMAADAFRHWTHRDSALQDLPVGMQRAFRQFGIDENGWDIIRKTNAEDLGNGNKAFLPSNILEHDQSEFATLAKVDTEAARIRARNDLGASYRNLLGELADRSTSAPSIANQANLGMGAVPAGTLQGELYRGALQLKGFAFNYMRNHIGRELLGYSQNKMGFGEAMATMLKGTTPGGASARAGLAKLIATGVGFGYISNTLRDVATGKTVEDPTGEHWGDAMKRAFVRQSFGLYSDFLLAEVPANTSFWERVGRMSGPEMGFASDSFNTLTRLGTHTYDALANGKDETDNFYKDAQKGFQTVYRNTPGTSLFWTKWALDYSVLNNISEELNPGYQQRLMDRAQKERGQSYMIGGAGPQTTGSQ
jgi:hypothetical protein